MASPPASRPTPSGPDRRRPGRQSLVHRANANRIGRITPSGVVTEFTTTRTSRTGSPPGRTATSGSPSPPIPARSRRSPRPASSRRATGGVTPASPPTASRSASRPARTATSGSPSKRRHRIGRITPAGHDHRVLRRHQRRQHARRIAAGPDGNLWFTELQRSDRIGRITPAGRRCTEFSPASPRIARRPGSSRPAPTATSGSPRSTGNRIGRITPAGAITEFSAGLTAGSYPSRDRRRPGRQPLVHREQTAAASGGSRPASTPPRYTDAGRIEVPAAGTTSGRRRLPGDDRRRGVCRARSRR